MGRFVVQSALALIGLDCEVVTSSIWVNRAKNQRAAIQYLVDQGWYCLYKFPVPEFGNAANQANPVSIPNWVIDAFFEDLFVMFIQLKFP